MLAEHRTVAEQLLGLGAVLQDLVAQANRIRCPCVAAASKFSDHWIHIRYMAVQCDPNKVCARCSALHWHAPHAT